MLSVKNVTKKYGKLKALDDVSFDLKEGTVTVLLGPNGAGKSTLMKSAIGYLKYEGEVTINGLSTKNEAARRVLGYIPELPSLYGNLTVREHMEFLARVYKLKDYKDKINSLFSDFELADKEKKFGDELSKGMQQKLNLCLGLLPEPEVLMLDEPMIGLDPHAIRKLKEKMIDMKNSGATLLVSTHIIDTMDELWDRTIIMQGGKIKADITKEELLQDGRTLEQLFFDVTEGLSSDDMQEGALKEETEKPEKKGFSLFGKKKKTEEGPVLR
ncbi:MAG: ABC transporter ATP-binding protein [Clostridia bacterium]|nr:ABC transporter ATP-binding protein [Clostridia bacterium]